MRDEKLLFLDYEGVLFQKPIGVPAPTIPLATAVNALNTLLGREVPSLVICSAWREGRTRGELEKELRGWGLTRASVVGLTPILKSTSNLLARRAQEINTWFTLTGRTPFSGNNYVILTAWPISGLGHEGRVVKPIGAYFMGQDVTYVRQRFGAHEEAMRELEKKMKEHEGQLTEGDVEGVGV